MRMEDQEAARLRACEIWNDRAGAAAYTATKAAQVAMVQQLALERYGIRINAACPGEIGTAINEKNTSQ